MPTLPEIFRQMNRSRVRYLLVGGYASVIHGVPRTTLDVDVAVDPTPANVRRVVEALRRVGLEPDTEREDEILAQGGVTATNERSVDVLTALPVGAFDEFWSGRVVVEYEGVPIPVVSRADQIRLLRAVGRPQDLEDAEVLETDP